MEYNRLLNDNGVYLYQDNNYNTIRMDFYFLTGRGNREDAINNLMCEYISKSNKVYSDIEEKQKELYYMNSSFNTKKEGKVTNIIYSIDMISPSKVSDNYLIDAFTFIRDYLLKPDFTDEKLLETIKRTYISEKLHALSDASKRASKLYRKFLFYEKDFEFVTSVDEKYIRSIIDSITLEDIKKAYESAINEDNFYRGLVFGDLSLEEFKMLRKYIPFKSKIGSLNYKDPTKIDEKYEEIIDKDTNESIVYVSYEIDNIDEKWLYLISEIFNGGSGLCHEILREKYGLVYSSYMSTYYYKNVLFFNAKIDKKNKQKLLDAIDEIVSIAMDEKKLKTYLDIAKRSIKKEAYLLSEEKDSIIDLLDDYIRDIHPEFDYNKFVSEIDLVREKDVADYVRTLRKKSVFMLVGDKR